MKDCDDSAVGAKFCPAMMTVLSAVYELWRSVAPTNKLNGA